MAKRTDRRQNIQANGKTSRPTARQTNGKTDRRQDRPMARHTSSWQDTQADGEAENLKARQTALTKGPTAAVVHVVLTSKSIGDERQTCLANVSFTI